MDKFFFEDDNLNESFATQNIERQKRYAKTKSDKEYAEIAAKRISDDEYSKIADNRIKEMEIARNREAGEQASIDATRDARKAYDTKQNIIKSAVAGAALVTAGVLISDAMKKKDWYKNKCEGISDDKKKSDCQAYVKKKTIKELRSQLPKCKRANNPDTCREIILDKIKRLG